MASDRAGARPPNETPDMPRTLRQVLPLLLALATAACAAAGPNPKQRLAGAYPDLEIRWLGNYDLVYTDEGYVGLERALAVVQGRGIAPERVEAASIEASTSRNLQMMQSQVAGRPTYYDVSLRITGCDNRVYFRTSFAGRIMNQRDPSDCLATE
jgi:hypothetical protein